MQCDIWRNWGFLLTLNIISWVSQERCLRKPITVWTVVQAVLTATFNSYGDRQILTPYKINTPEPIDKKIGHSWLRPRGDPVYQIWYKFTHWGLLGKWVKYNKTLFFIYTFFSQSRAQVRPVDGFLHAIAQKTWNHARMCLLGVWIMCPKFWG